MSGIFQRHPNNPILTRRDMPVPAASVFNPGAAEVDGRVLLLLRAEDRRGISSLWTAWSSDGVTGWEIDPQPLIYAENSWEAWGCEDPRISWVEELGQWVIVYTAYSMSGPGVALARTTDFKTVEKLGLVLAPSNKDAALFPRRIDGQWALIHRPVAGGIADIWVAVSPDLIHWGRPGCLVRSRGDVWWDGTRVGAGPPPIEVPEGWLLLYHGVKQMVAGPIYRLGAVLLDRDDPYQLLARTDEWIFGPVEDYEYRGDVPGVVFPCGALRRGEELWVYYGAADVTVCLATVRLPDLMTTLRPAEAPG